MAHEHCKGILSRRLLGLSCTDVEGEFCGDVGQCLWGIKWDIPDTRGVLPVPCPAGELCWCPGSLCAIEWSTQDTWPWGALSPALLGSCAHILAHSAAPQPLLGLQRGAHGASAVLSQQNKALLRIKWLWLLCSYLGIKFIHASKGWVF